MGRSIKVRHYLENAPADFPQSSIDASMPVDQRLFGARQWGRCCVTAFENGKIIACERRLAVNSMMSTQSSRYRLAVHPHVQSQPVAESTQASLTADATSLAITTRIAIGGAGNVYRAWRRCQRGHAQAASSMSVFSIIHCLNSRADSGLE